MLHIPTRSRRIGFALSLMSWFRYTVTLLVLLGSIGGTDALSSLRSGRRPPFRQFRLFRLDNNHEILLYPSPLIGGPQWLPLHVKLVLHYHYCDDDDGNMEQNDKDSFFSWDFVPLNATDQDVLTKLTTLQPVPGEIRSSLGSSKIPFFEKESMNAKAETIKIIQQSHEFCETYPRDLHLISNNCWTFALGLALFLADSRQKNSQNNN